jgi:LruC domain-containing protein
VLNNESTIWVTFVSEGAGYHNTLGYYRYNINNPPASAANIDSIHIIFPNVSFTGSGGGLASGNRVKLGTFPPGTELGWVLISDGFRNGTITTGNGLYFSNRDLNPEADVNKRQHTCLLNDIGRGKFLLSFEDLKRDAGSDNDFNDAVFYITANPVQAIATQNIPLPNYTQLDSDRDGISNAFDNYPTDPLKAFDNYYPSKDNFGSLAFEDLWPSQGDYDFNDMVVDYNFNQVTNGQNKVVQIKLRALLTAMGGYYANGLGIQLPISTALISSVTGNNIQGSYIVQNSNGTESGQSKATIIIFDNGFNLLPYQGGGTVGVNTTKGAAYVTPKELNITINLTTPVSLGTMGLPPYNPFMIKDGERSSEVHLIDNQPTDLANIKLLGTSDDDSKPATGRYYVTRDNLPFAIDIPSHFDYPVEKTQVTQAYLKFVSWGESSGTQFYDWFKSNPGYRSVDNVFSH